ncbi:MAG TPA: LLM class flavin-dependent oxidoreductase [Acidimicrobiales bacterium]|nr:LLM class flavin-dependent oxidoreductase [Acidimicrobiales bacterium]
MDISCAFATSMDTPAWVAEAERLGYRRAWCYDSPGLYPDVWMTLGRAAERTSAIGLGPAVLVPSLRHPMVNAAGVAGLAALAPGRVAVAVGAGFTGRMVLGQRPMRWDDVAAYVRSLRALLRGESTEWNGAVIQMLHPEGFGAPRPLEVPILIGADGPKGMAVAAELGDGVFSAGVPQAVPDSLAWRALLQFGTVLDDDEDPGGERVAAAAGHAVGVVYHALYERGGPAAVDGFPGGRVWRESIEQAPAAARHLSVHDSHLVAQNRHDRLAWPEAAPLIKSLSLTGTAAEISDRLARLEESGVTEVAYQPAGPDVGRELAAFASAAGVGGS